MAFHPAALRKRRIAAAEGYLILDMPEQALLELAAVDPKNSPSGPYYRLRGEAYRLLCRHAEALVDYQREWDAGRIDLSLLLGMAWCYKRTDQLEKSIEMMQSALQVSPEEPIVPYNLSCYYALAGDRDRALTWLQQALQMQGALRDMLAEETDFDAIRNDEEFLRLAKFGGDERQPVV